MRRIIQIFIVLAIFVLPIQANGQSVAKKSESVVHIDGTNYYIHNVAQGETIYSLSKLYEVSEEDITRNNPHTREGIKVEQVLKIPVLQQQQMTRRQSRLFDEHSVRAGETTYSIARSYGISLTTLIEDNPGIDPTLISTGQVLLIRKKEMGETSPSAVTQQWEGYRDAANQVSDEYVYHIVKPGETIFSLSRMFGVSQDTLKDLNELEDGLKANAMIRIPVESAMFPNNNNDIAIQDIPVDNQENTTISFEPRPGNPSSFRPNTVPNIALMLPLEGTVATNSDFVDFYRGTLLALEDLKSAGHSMNVTLYNSARSGAQVRDIVTSADFSETDLIIGPVYEAGMWPAIQFAEAYNVPIVSPLAPVNNTDSDMLYQMAPDLSTKYGKLHELLHGGKNIILVSSGSADDKEFEQEITAELGSSNYGRFTIGTSGDIASLIDWERENVLIILAGTELGVDKALASISSAYNNASARRSRRADIKIVGSSRWAGFSSNSIDKDLYFKLNVCFVTSYYIDRSSGIVARFEARFLETYGHFPSRSAYRGYDAVKLFAGALFEPGNSFQAKLSPANTFTPIQTPYRFVQKSGTNRHTNDQWVLVSFKNSSEISVQ